MDVNGTRFHLLLGRDDWSSCKDEEQGRTLSSLWDSSPPVESNAVWDIERQELILRPRLFQFIQASGRRLTVEKRSGAGRDIFGNWYSIGETGYEILVNSSGTRRTSHFWSAGDGLECSRQDTGDFLPREEIKPLAKIKLRALAVTEDHYLAVGTTKPAGLLIFDLISGGPPRHLLWPEDVPFSPFDMAPAPVGGLWILDCEFTDPSRPPLHARYWRLDRHFNVLSAGQEAVSEQEDEFQPKDGGAARRIVKKAFPEGILLDAASPLTPLDAIAIEGLPDGTVLILDRNGEEPFSLIYRYKSGKRMGEPVSTESMRNWIEKEERPGFRLKGYDFAFVKEHVETDGKVFEDRLYIVGEDGNQAVAFKIYQENGELKMEPLVEYFPMRLFGGKGLVTADTQAYYDFNDLWVPLTEQRRLRYRHEATLNTTHFDGREPDCVWHRLMLDAVIPHEAKVEIWSRAANEKKDLKSAQWQKEPELYPRKDGREIQFTLKNTACGFNTWESLFQNAHGRYLELRIKLTGNGRITPRLHALRAYFPRFSYLEHYLPAVYREDSKSASFLDRFLANIEGFYTAIEDKVAAVQALFDYSSTPSDALDWLANWFEFALDSEWDDNRKRLFIKHAMDFFQYRGTIRGLQMALHLSLDACFEEAVFTDDMPGRRKNAIRIIEKYRTRRTPGVVCGDPTVLGGGPRTIPEEARWKPKHGRDEFNRRYSMALRLPVFKSFPLKNPLGDKGDTWMRFSHDILGFIPSASAGDLKLWQDFLARRYRNIASINKVYWAKWTKFEDIPLPEELPCDGAPLIDWYQFEGVVLSVRRTAHRFTVMLPMPKNEVPYSPEHERRLALAKRVIEMEKPAHTVFDVKFYWDMFRIGGVRLGDDTVVDKGSRAAELMTPMILGRRHIGESYIASARPMKPTGRYTPSC